MKKNNDVVNAKVVDVADNIEPIESVVVGDRRNTFGRRLGLFAIFILLLFFAVGGYIESSTNHDLLKRAAIDRSRLVDSNHRITESLSKLVKDNNRQAKQINHLQNTLHKQNKILRENGLKTVYIPSVNAATGRRTNPSTIHHHKSVHQHKTKHHRHHRHHNGHSPKPGPVPTPVKSTTCKIAGVCIHLERTNSNDKQEVIRQLKVYCTSRSTSGWSSIFCAFADLGLARR